METPDSGRKLIEMIEQDNKLVFQYWGKADDKLSTGLRWHPLVYHSLDVKSLGG